MIVDVVYELVDRGAEVPGHRVDLREVVVDGPGIHHRAPVRALLAGKRVQELGRLVVVDADAGDGGGETVDLIAELAVRIPDVAPDLDGLVERSGTEILGRREAVHVVHLLTQLDVFLFGKAHRDPTVARLFCYSSHLHKSLSPEGPSDFSCGN